MSEHLNANIFQQFALVDSAEITNILVFRLKSLWFWLILSSRQILMFWRYIDIFLQDCMVAQAKGPQYKQSPSWKPQNSYFYCCCVIKWNCCLNCFIQNISKHLIYLLHHLFACCYESRVLVTLYKCSCLDAPSH